MNARERIAELEGLIWAADRRRDGVMQTGRVPTRDDYDHEAVNRLRDELADLEHADRCPDCGELLDDHSMRDGYGRCER